MVVVVNPRLRRDIKMDTQSILAAVSEEIARLEQVKVLLSAGTGRVPDTSFRFGAKPRKKRVMSKEARERIAAAQRKRWAAQKKAAK
jgi:hypothetical protein